MTRNIEVHTRAAKLADMVVHMLLKAGVSEAAVVVTRQAWTEYPLAVRTPSEGGWGMGTELYFDAQRKLLQHARLQAEYQLRTGGRTAAKQEEKLRMTGRSATSYGTLFSSEFKAGYAYDERAELTVVATSKYVDPGEAALLSEQAIIEIDHNVEPPQLPAAEFLMLCLQQLLELLPTDRTGVAMVASPVYRANLSDMSHGDPVVIASQTAGPVVEPANFAIVAAKAKTVAITRQASNLQSIHRGSQVSQIEGAIGVGIGEEQVPHVIAAGGLIEGYADVEAILHAIQLFKGTPISVLEFLSEIRK